MIPERFRHGKKNGEQRPEPGKVAGDSQSGGTLGVAATTLDQDHRVETVGRQTESLAQIVSYRGLQRSETESLFLVPGQKEPDSAAAKIADSVEENNRPIGGRGPGEINLCSDTQDPVPADPFRRKETGICANRFVSNRGHS